REPEPGRVTVASTRLAGVVHSPATTSARRVPGRWPGTTMMVAGRPWYLARSTSRGRLPPVTCATQAGDRAEGPLAGAGKVGPAPVAACWRDRVSAAVTWAFSWPGW